MWLLHFMHWPVAGTALFALILTVLSLIGAAVAGLVIAGLLWCYVALLLWARHLLRRGKPRVAGMMVSIGILALVVLIGVFEPRTLLMVPVSGLFAMVVGLRTLETRDLRTVAVVAWLVQGGALLLAALLPLSMPEVLERIVFVIGGAIGLGVTFLLLWQHHAHLASLFSRLRRTNDDLSLAHAALADSATRYELALGAGQVLVWDWCLRTDRLLVQGRSDHLFLARDGVLIGSQFWKQLLHPDDAERVQATLGAYLEGHLASYEVAHRVIDRQGETHHILTRAELLRDASDSGMRLVGTCTDVTAQVRAEVALAASEARYRELTKLASDYTFTMQLGPDGAAQLEGVTALFSEPLGQQIADYIAHRKSGQLGTMVYEDDLPRYEAFLDRLRRGEESSVELRVHAVHRGIRWMLVQARPERTPAAQGTRRILGVARDITARREATEAVRFLAEAGASLATAVDYADTLQRTAHLVVPGLADHCAIDLLASSSADLVAVAHRDSEREGALRELLRRFPIDLESEHPVARVLREGRSALYATVDDALIEANIRDANHRALLDVIGWTRSAMIVPLVTRGRVIGAISFARVRPGLRYSTADLNLAEELTRRVALAVDNAHLIADLRASERRYRSLITAAGSMIGCVDPDGRITEFNPEAERITGYNRDEVIGRDYADLFEPHIERVRVMRDIQLVLEGENVRDSESEIVVRNGERRVVIWNLTPILDGEDRPAGVLAIGQDVTDRRRAEEAQRRLEQSMQQAQRLESLGVMAGGIAHDFNNLLAVIVGNAGIARLELGDDHPTVESITQIERASQRAAELVRQMLAYAGRGRVNAELLDFNQLIGEMADLLATSVPRTIRFDIQLGSQLPAILADGAQIQQVVMNLVINAAESITGAGTVTLTTGVRRMAVTERIGTLDVAAGEYVQLVVEDTGCGMDEATLARIFDPFFTTKFAGRGLGLAAVLGIVRSHKGALDVVSAPNRGTRFTVLIPGQVALTPTLPQFDQPAQHIAHNHARPAPLVLVVDDDPSVLRIAARLAERTGFRALTANDGVEALELFAMHREQVACVLLDLTMPRMDGEQTLHQIRITAPELPIVLMSGHSAEEMSERFAAVPRTQFLQKPFTADQLQDALNVSLAR